MLTQVSIHGWPTSQWDHIPVVVAQSSTQGEFQPSRQSLLLNINFVTIQKVLLIQSSCSKSPFTRWVITADHCVSIYQRMCVDEACNQREYCYKLGKCELRPLDSISIELGAHNISWYSQESRTQFKPSRIVVHPTVGRDNAMHLM